MKTTRYEVKQIDFDYTKKLSGSFFCSYEWISFVRSNQGGIPILLEINEHNVVKAYFVSILIKKAGIKILGSPFEGWLSPDMGFIPISDIDYNEAIECIVSFAFHNLKCKFIQICDKKINHDCIKIKHKVEYTKLLEIDITRPEETILESFTKNGRRDVRASQRKGIKVIRVPFDYEFANIYYDQLIDVFDKQGLEPNYKKEKVLEMVDFLKDRQELVLALEAINQEGKVVATVFSFGMNEWAYYVGAASYRKYQGALPNEALFWTFVTYWKSQGIKYLDLMGYRKYKMKYNPTIINQPRLIFQKYPGLYFGKKVMYHLVSLIRRIKGRFKTNQKRRYENSNN